MAVREILTYPDPRLNQVAKPVERFDHALAQLAQDMVETMRVADGIGLAAPQIGELIELIVVEVPIDDEQEAHYVICNPVIKEGKGCHRIEEGCLSLPEFTQEVDRLAWIRLQGQQVDGTPIEIEADGLLAICLQHEMDHLKGKLLVNYAGSLKREQYRKDVQRYRQQQLSQLEAESD